MEKFGSGHFEMVIAFTFFVGFVFFLFTVLETDTSDGLYDSVLNDVGDNFFELVKTDFGSVFVSVDYSDGGCFYLDLGDGVFDFDYDGKGVIVESLDGSVVDSGFVSGVLSVNSDEDFFRVKFSDEFVSGGVGGCSLVDSYELGSVVEREVVSEFELFDLESRYFSDYEGLRGDLRIPVVYEFGVVVEELGIEMMPSSEISSSLEVLVREEVFEVLGGDGEISNVRVSFRVW